MTARMAVLLLGAATLPAAQLVELTAITEYPLLAVAARISGTVRVACRLAADGTVESVRVLEGPPLLAPRATEAARLWRFEAPQKDGEDPVIEFEFRLTKPAADRPSARFRFQWPNRAIIESQERCADHAPCGAEKQDTTTWK